MIFQHLLLSFLLLLHFRNKRPVEGIMITSAITLLSATLIFYFRNKRPVEGIMTSVNSLKDLNNFPKNSYYIRPDKGFYKLKV